MAKKKYSVGAAIKEICTSAKKLRDEKGLSQSQVSFESEVTSQTIVNIEKGKTSPSIENILKLLKVYGKTLVIKDIEEK